MLKLNKELNDLVYWIKGYKKITVNHDYHIPWYMIIYNKIFNYFNINNNNDKWFGKINF